MEKDSSIYPPSVCGTLDEVSHIYGDANADFSERLVRFFRQTIAEGAILPFLPSQSIGQFTGAIERVQQRTRLDFLNMENIMKAWRSNPGSCGMYMSNQVGGVIVLNMEKPTHALAATLVHELTHKWHHFKGTLRSMSIFESEYLAYSAEQLFLQCLPMRVIPSEMRFLYFCPKAQLVEHILSMYRQTTLPKEEPILDSSRIFG